MLCRDGIDARIIFGARKRNNEMQAHAWVEVNGVSLDEDNDKNQPFSPFEEITPSHAN
jgi:hypothetical protein